MLFADNQEPVFHLIAPRTVPWDTIFHPIAERLGLQVAPYADWLVHVKQSAEDARQGADAGKHDAAHSLLDFFSGAGVDVELSTEKAVRVSKALTELEPLSAEDAMRYVEFWGKVGYIRV